MKGTLSDIFYYLVCLYLNRKNNLKIEENNLKRHLKMNLHSVLCSSSLEVLVSVAAVLILDLDNHCNGV